MENFLPAYYHSSLFRQMDGLLTAFCTFHNCAIHQKSLKLFVDTLPSTNRVDHKYDPSEVGAIWSALFCCLQHISFCMLLFFQISSMVPDVIAAYLLKHPSHGQIVSNLKASILSHFSVPPEHHSDVQSWVNYVQRSDIIASPPTVIHFSRSGLKLEPPQLSTTAQEIVPAKIDAQSARAAALPVVSSQKAASEFWFNFSNFNFSVFLLHQKTFCIHH